MRIGTRRSALALAQARAVAERLQGDGAGDVELVPISTSGDRDQGAGDKSRWVAELEEGLANGALDLAVHSAKDVPGDLAEGLELLGTPKRAAMEDVLCGAAGLEALAAGARVGSSSIRREAQLRSAREDLHVVAIRGNVDTRLRKLADSDLDAIVLARAGLERLELESEIGAVLELERFVPAPGQGIVVLEGRTDDAVARGRAERITDAETFACLQAERALARELNASCHTPLGACAVPAGCGCLLLRAWVGLPDGSAWASDELLGGFYDPQELGRNMAERLTLAGAPAILSRAEEMARVGNA
jgi:hydroxymethylbilane synthase